MSSRWLRRVLALVVLVLLAGAGAAFYLFNKPYNFVPAPLSYDLRAGLNLRTVSRELGTAGVLKLPWLLELAGRLRGDAPRIKAGNYEIESPISPAQLLLKLTSGDATQVGVRINEGWNFRQVREALNTHDALAHDTRDLSDEAIARKLGAPGVNLEGWLFPDTYHVSRGVSDWSVLQRAYRLMQRHLNEQWGARAQNLPLGSAYEALILASIVEKETGRAADRPLVAAVFVNRLRNGMRLQTDPTVIYGLGAAFNGNLRRADLLADTPWNTYTRVGLPPTPIAMPGLAALQAATSPPDSRMLYFVSRGDGSSHFSPTLEAHNAAVTKYQRAGRAP